MRSTDSKTMSSEDNSLKGLENLEAWLEKFQDKNLSSTSLAGKNVVILDIFGVGVARRYCENWVGCRDLWKSSYWIRKERRTSRDAQC